MCAATCDIVWLRILLQDATEEQKDATVIRCDNPSSIKLSNYPMFHKNTKHEDTAPYEFSYETHGGRGNHHYS